MIQVTVTPAARPDVHEYVEAPVVGTPRRVQDVDHAVSTLNRKLRRLEELSLFTIRASRGQGTIRVTVADPDRTLTGQPDIILAAVAMDQDTTAVALYQVARDAYGKGYRRFMEFGWGDTDPEFHDMTAAWRLLLDLHGDAGAPGRRADWTDREVLEWIRDHHVDGLKALESVETLEASMARLYGPHLKRGGRF